MSRRRINFTAVNRLSVTLGVAIHGCPSILLHARRIKFSAIKLLRILLETPWKSIRVLREQSRAFVSNVRSRNYLALPRSQFEMQISPINCISRCVQPSGLSKRSCVNPPHGRLLADTSNFPAIAFDHFVWSATSVGMSRLIDSLLFLSNRIVPQFQTRLTGTPMLLLYQNKFYFIPCGCYTLAFIAHSLLFIVAFVLLLV